MGLSGSSDYDSTRNEIINFALRKTGQLAEGETASSQQVQDAAEDLETLIKLWQAAGLHLWKYEEMVLFLIKEQESYDIPGSENWVKESDLTTTTTNTDEVISSTSIGVTSITGMSSADIIGIAVDDNTIHWDVINGAPTGTTVTLTTGLDVAATSGNAVYVYTSAAVRPLQITHGRTQVSTGSEVEITMIGREDYFRLSNKAASGSVVQAYYNPKLTNGKLYVWPTTSDERQFLNLTTQISIEDMDAAGNNPDFPTEWLAALKWNLAEWLLPEYGMTDQVTVGLIQGMAAKTYKLAEDYDIEEADIIFAPNYD